MKCTATGHAFVEGGGPISVDGDVMEADYSLVVLITLTTLYQTLHPPPQKNSFPPSFTTHTSPSLPHFLPPSTLPPSSFPPSTLPPSLPLPSLPLPSFPLPSLPLPSFPPSLYPPSLPPSTLLPSLPNSLVHSGLQCRQSRHTRVCPSDTP